MSQADFVEGDTGSQVQVTCTNVDGSILNLTSYTATLRWKDAAGAVKTASMMLLSAVNGVVSYVFAAADLVAGPMEAEVIVTAPGGAFVTQVGPFFWSVRKKIA